MVCYWESFKHSAAVISRASSFQGSWLIWKCSMCEHCLHMYMCTCTFL